MKPEKRSHTLPRWAVALTSICASTSAFAAETKGQIEFYKGGEHSSFSHFLVTGPAAQSMFDHLREVPETRDEAQGYVSRRNADMECTYYYKDTLRERLCRDTLPPGHTPEELEACLKAARFHRCEFRMDERGRVHGGYAN